MIKTFDKGDTFIDPEGRTIVVISMINIAEYLCEMTMDNHVYKCVIEHSELLSLWWPES